MEGILSNWLIMVGGGNGLVPSPNSRIGYPSERYPLPPGYDGSEVTRHVPLHNGRGIATLHKISRFGIQTDGIESFYFTCNFMLTRPEVIYKKVYTSYIKKFKFESARDLDASYIQDLFHRLIQGKDLKYFLDGSLKKVELERVWVIDNPESSHVAFLETWDFENHVIRYGPKLRTEFDHQEEGYNTLFPLMYYELSHDAKEEEACIDAFGIYPDDYERLPLLLQTMEDKIDRMFETCNPCQWEIKNSGFKNHPTLLCVDRHLYLQFYRDLKSEHYDQLRQLWVRHGETTDYSKFVPEDLHIATYLECLQPSLRSPIKFGKKFVDLGCGNGLLTHLLTQCGWKGYGVDCRKRNLWDHFSNEGADLEELTVAYNTSLRDIDSETLLIGNHPDELCPLIPLLARQTGAAGFLIIPCCAFDVFGKKYHRSDTEFSVYESHLRALTTMCSNLGFDIRVDKLRIPSTKRIVILGGLRTRELPESDRRGFQENFDELMHNLDANQPDIRVPREKFLRVNNCTQLCRTTCESIIEDIFDAIYFSNCNRKCRSCEKIAWWEVPKWHLGCEKVTIRMLTSILSADRLKFLKGQGNGLQTLIKNYSDIFSLQEGFVRIHLPEGNRKSKMIAEGKEHKLGKKPCFFFNHHLDGCPLKSDECAFSHVSSLTKVPLMVEPRPKVAFFEGESKPILLSELRSIGYPDPDAHDEDSDGYDPVGEAEEGIPDFEENVLNGPVFYM